MAKGDNNNGEMKNDSTTVTPKSKPKKWVIIPRLKKTESEHFINFGG
ncbi:hypothetical protein [Morganella morganii]|nr:hypothetical protein [Morganella morganii]MBT0422618.1 hypothetical protein [Morganella morganii subsp. morganii]MBT0517241.1 hypothetical protein [Morganella morganii subsp. morganii]UNJ79670.1 hypothetical protein [Morganella morganii]